MHEVDLHSQPVAGPIDDASNTQKNHSEDPAPLHSAHDDVQAPVSPSSRTQNGSHLSVFADTSSSSRQPVIPNIFPVSVPISQFRGKKPRELSSSQASKAPVNTEHHNTGTQTASILTPSTKAAISVESQTDEKSANSNNTPELSHKGDKNQPKAIAASSSDIPNSHFFTTPETPAPSSYAPTSNNNNTQENFPIDAGVIRCICGFSDDDGYTIQCEKCNAWQHAVCVGISDESQVPEIYLCDRCGDRKVDVKYAIEKQRERLKSTGSSRRKPKPGSSRSKPSTPSPSEGGSPLTSKEIYDDTSNAMSKTASSSSDSKADINHSEALDSNVNVKNLEQTSTDKKGSVTETEKDAKRSTDQGTKSPKESSSHGRQTSSTTNARTSSSPNSGQKKSRNSRRLTVQNSGASNAISQASAQMGGDDVSESDMDLDRTYSLNNLGDSYYAKIEKNRILSSKLLQYLNDLIKAAENDMNTSILSSQEFLKIVVPKICVKLTSDHSKQKFSGFSRFGLFVETTIPRDRFVIEYVGEVMTKEQYKTNPINQYRDYGCPKPGVLFHPSLPIAVDSRLIGSEARFMRRSCTPNCRVSTLIIDDNEVRFGVFSSEQIKAGSELTIAWEWDPLHPAQLLQAGKQLEDLSREERLYLVHVSHMFEQRGVDCGCGANPDCLLVKMRNAAGIQRTTRNNNKTRVRESDIKPSKPVHVSSTNNQSTKHANSIKQESEPADISVQKAEDSQSQSDSNSPEIMSLKRSYEATELRTPNQLSVEKRKLVHQSVQTIDIERRLRSHETDNESGQFLKLSGGANLLDTTFRKSVYKQFLLAKERHISDSNNRGSMGSMENSNHNNSFPDITGSTPSLSSGSIDGSLGNRWVDNRGSYFGSQTSSWNSTTSLLNGPSPRTSLSSSSTISSPVFPTIAATPAATRIRTPGHQQSTTPSVPSTSTPYSGGIIKQPAASVKPVKKLSFADYRKKQKPQTDGSTGAQSDSTVRSLETVTTTAVENSK